MLQHHSPPIASALNDWKAARSAGCSICISDCVCPQRIQIIVSMSGSVLFALASTRKNVKTLQKREKPWHEKQYLTLHGSCLISVKTRFVEYPVMFAAVGDALVPIPEPMPIIICLPGPPCSQGVANPVIRKVRSRHRARQEG